jgi:hypothetical protein
MALVCLLTFPLTFVPPAQMIEKISYRYLSELSCFNNHSYIRINNNDSNNYSSSNNIYNNNNNNNSSSNDFDSNSNNNSSSSDSRMNVVNGAGRNYNSINNSIKDSNSDNENNEKDEEKDIPLYFTYVNRLLLLTFISYLSNYIPCFGDVSI